MNRIDSVFLQMLLTAVASMTAIVAMISAKPVGAQAIRSADFINDPHWESYRSRLVPEEVPIVRQDFGWSFSSNADGEMPGEIGGWVQRSRSPARYSFRLARPRTLDERLEASGRLAVTRDAGSSGVLIGWFNSTSRGWRTPNSLAMRVDGNGDKYWLFFEYGTQNGKTGGGGAFEGERYQDTKTIPFPADGSSHTWRLVYEPTANGGNGGITFQVDDRIYGLPVRESDRRDGAVFDRFGIWNQETTGDGMEMWVDDLVINGRPVDLESDPSWESVGARAKFAEQIVRPFHDFGYSTTTHINAQPGEAGGVIWRDEQPSYFADKVGKLTLDQSLQASGKVSFLSSAADSAVYLGWFDSQSKQRKQRPEHEERQQNYLAILLEGPSRVGHYFRPGYASHTGTGFNADKGPLLRTDGRVHDWSIHYEPDANHRRGEITVTLDNHAQTIQLRSDDRDIGARFDRFGLFNLQSGGWHVELYIDELRYTAATAKRTP